MTVRCGDGVPLSQAAMRYFTMLIQPLRHRAKELGYALAVHGSLARDIDLIAVPWTTKAVPEPELAEELRKVAEQICGGAVDLDRDPPQDMPRYFIDGMPGFKSHGRLSWSFYLGPTASTTYLDLAVMPRQHATDGT